MPLIPPPQLIPQTLAEKPFFKSLLDSVYSLWFNAEKLVNYSESELLTTIDATTTTLDLIPVDDETTVQIESIIVAVQSGGSNRAGYVLRGTFYRSGAGAVQQGSTTVDHTTESDATWAAAYDVSGNDVRIRVTGAAASISWRATSKVMSLSN